MDKAQVLHRKSIKIPILFTIELADIVTYKSFNNNISVYQNENSGGKFLKKSDIEQIFYKIHLDEITKSKNIELNSSFNNRTSESLHIFSEVPEKKKTF